MWWDTNFSEDHAASVFTSHWRWKQQYPPKGWHIRCHNPEDLDFYLHRGENLKSHKFRNFLCFLEPPLTVILIPRTAVCISMESYVLTVYIRSAGARIAELRAGWLGSLSPGTGWEIFLLTPASRPSLGPTSLLSNGYRGFFPWG
jgi:hypothetical protein